MTDFANRQAEKTLPRELKAARERIAELEQVARELKLEKETLCMMLKQRATNNNPTAGAPWKDMAPR